MTFTRLTTQKIFILQSYHYPVRNSSFVTNAQLPRLIFKYKNSKINSAWSVIPRFYEVSWNYPQAIKSMQATWSCLGRAITQAVRHRLLGPGSIPGQVCVKLVVDKVVFQSSAASHHHYHQSLSWEVWILTITSALSWDFTTKPTLDSE
jgi:hypothetical protein